VHAQWCLVRTIILGRGVGPRPIFERSLVKYDHFGLRQLVKGGAQDKAEIAGSRPLFGSFLGFGNM
jgi:hypothetical protein